MAQAQFPEPRSIDILEIGDGVDIKVGQYSLDKPHPGYGKDPNIINQLGHTVYPKWVDSKSGGRVIVNSPAEEAEATGNEVKEQKPAKIDGWE